MRKFIYIKLRRNRVEARIVGKTKDEVFSAKALSHPRAMAGDFEQLVELYQSIIEHYKTWTDYIFKPDLFIHFVEKSEGGYTNSETKIMKLASEQAGAHFSWLCLDAYGPFRS
ncbi:MAG: hypothetical protein KJ556_16990 [Gammaproteobacteria bacterium]|nr:hypothetical protein [Gammaproteobacteria bacterium]MBU2057462.1 hypothetical protein [Gammaproteobacteria bacterium]MBU2176810.1 hypothetical protein [Gammaproteobacteria bacterium]MBU2247922.1 hypothetical protein [Gammaproteobacteria bacterium]MBU2342660.1 hypothetical protein [Gammaproteobacteria bacterium]